MSFLVLFPFMPESPYFLLRKGKDEQAKAALKWLRRKTDIEEDFVQLKADVQRQTSEKGTWKELVTVEANRKALLAGVFLRISQQFCGLQAFTVYTKYIFEKSGSNLSPDMSALVYSGMVLILNSATCFMTEYLGKFDSTETKIKVIFNTCENVAFYKLSTNQNSILERGAFHSSQNVGQFGIDFMGSYLDVKQTSYICLIVPMFFLMLFPFMPESLYFLLRKGKDEEAKAVLKWLRRKADIEEDFVQLKADVQRQTSEKGTWKELVTVEANRKALLAGVFLRISQQFCGLQAFTVYTKYIFEKSGSNLSPDMSTLVYSGMVLILNSATCFMTEYLGRRRSYTYSIGACAIVLWILGTYFVIDEFQPQIDLSSFQWVPLAGLVCYTIVSSFGVMMIPTLMLSELFSASIKSKGLMIMSFIIGAGTTSVIQLFYFLNTTFGMFCPFMLFAACSTVSSVLTNWIVPETKGMTLEEIQQSLKKKKKESVTKSEPLPQI
ncbi:unnamed protein product [Callosobruchus maculatus]|uniref:Major facilitator superfamily (MFS) profile domain-containing protein n=1 Tax=Callosobruchus maculatus TaxID=64391 RepID=A0A653D279_CALMS|nr:unnamed protein product [Callosobruchus maculatus]